MADEVFPIIDLSQGNNWPDTKGPEIVEACKKWGFMILTGHGIPKHIIDSMFEMVRLLAGNTFISQ
jgi:isopenicillin N synthase-like dioxygenase